LPIAKGNQAIHYHDADSHRVLKWRVERRLVRHGRRIEYHDIRRFSLRYATAIHQADASGRLRRHLSNRLLEGERFPFTHVSAEHSRERAGTSRMRTPATRRTVDGKPASVTAHHAKRMRKNLFEILFAHSMSKHSDCTLASRE
jgi:hypothetical protein